MKKVILGLLLVLFSVTMVFSQGLVFVSDSYFAVVDEDRQETVETSTLITFDRGLVRIIWSSEDEDYTNLLLTNAATKGEADGYTYGIIPAIDRGGNVCSVSIATFDDGHHSVGIFSSSGDMYFMGEFVNTQKHPSKPSTEYKFKSL